MIALIRLLLYLALEIEDSSTPIYASLHLQASSKTKRRFQYYDLPPRFEGEPIVSDMEKKLAKGGWFSWVTSRARKDMPGLHVDRSTAKSLGVDRVSQRFLKSVDPF